MDPWHLGKPVPPFSCAIRCDSRALEESAHLLLGRLILEAGVLQVISPHGLVLVIGGAQELNGLLDGHGASVNLVTTDPVSKRNTELAECSAKTAVSGLRVTEEESMIKYKLLSHCHIEHTVHL